MIIPIKDVDIVIIVFPVVSVGAGGKEMNCDCPCHDPNVSGGRLCTICAKNYINCKKHGINNLLWYPLPDGWRLVYTILTLNNKEIIAGIVEYFDHKNYERRFHY